MEGGNCPSKFLAVVKISCPKISSGSGKFEAKNNHFGKEILSSHVPYFSVMLKICAVCLKIATFCPEYFFQLTTPLACLHSELKNMTPTSVHIVVK